ncbi:hypothetical protein LCGC14_2096070 [marine sediment metagenome]|uniref:Uncharacterized protein n=1 Tax=marine sediment metagenome TaxID=412755 RepID=A0A0F9EBB9_9ZZZZ
MLAGSCALIMGFPSVGVAETGLVVPATAAAGVPIWQYFMMPGGAISALLWGVLYSIGWGALVCAWGMFCRRTVELVGFGVFAGLLVFERLVQHRVVEGAGIYAAMLCVPGSYILCALVVRRVFRWLKRRAELGQPAG